MNTLRFTWLLLLLPLPIPLQASPWSESYRLESLYQFDAAIELIKPLLGKLPGNEFAQLRVAWLQYQKGDYSQSAASYRVALEGNPKSLDARLGLSLPLMAQQRWREAMSVLQQVLEAAPWHFMAHTRLLEIEAAQKQWSVMKQHAADLHAHYPTDVGFLVYLARGEDRTGNKSAAANVYNKVLEILPEHAEANWYISNGVR